jgi:uncharacterized protein YndB with AHSA1/START domain
MIVAAAPTPSEDNVIVITRVVDAPRALVFEAFTQPQHLAQFWGPKGFSAPVCEVDLRVGGRFRVDLRGPDGATYPCTGIYREIVPGERLVYANPPGGGAAARPAPW